MAWVPFEHWGSVASWEICHTCSCSSSFLSICLEPSTLQDCSHIISKCTEFVQHSPPVSLMQPRVPLLQYPPIPSGPQTPLWPDNWILQARAAHVWICPQQCAYNLFLCFLTELNHRLLLPTHTHTRTHRRLHVCKYSLRYEGEKYITYHFLPSQSRMRSPSLAVKKTLWHTLLTHWLAVGGQASGSEREIAREGDARGKSKRSKEKQQRHMRVSQEEDRAAQTLQS